MRPAERRHLVGGRAIATRATGASSRMLRRHRDDARAGVHPGPPGGLSRSIRGVGRMTGAPAARTTTTAEAAKTPIRPVGTGAEHVRPVEPMRSGRAAVDLKRRFDCGDTADPTRDGTCCGGAHSRSVIAMTCRGMSASWTAGSAVATLRTRRRAAPQRPTVGESGGRERGPTCGWRTWLTRPRRLRNRVAPLVGPIRWGCAKAATRVASTRSYGDAGATL